MNLNDIISNFNQHKIVVIGDVMLDKEICGEVSRISPEALAFVLKVKSKSQEFYSPGGAANAAANVSSLGGKTSLFGFVGEDIEGGILKKILEERGINCYFGKNEMTTLKIRPKTVRFNLPTRIDYDDETPKDFSPELMEKMQEEIANSDLIVVSDYAKGAINKNLMNFLRKSNKKIIIDPKPQNMSLYSNSFLITPNEKEALEVSSQKDIQCAGRWLKENLKCNVLITRGEKGMSLFSDNEIEIPTVAKEVYDVAGAGDTVIAALSLSIASGASFEEAIIIANHAAGIAVGKAGTYQVKLSELEKEIYGEERKLKTLDELSSIVEDLKKKQKRIVWTNGCFDLFHAGHKYSLEQAKKRGDFLIVGLDSDESVKILKGPERPIINQEQRAGILSGMEIVDYITIFSAGEASKYLRMLKPDVYVKSGNYTLDTINQEERKIIEGYGGEIYLPKGLPGFSTTDIIKKIRKTDSPNDK
jgi:D-beta-D-heptose 7-phosphate kinase/D-beta-D-heptose 1-phosphate adenosyltransferase